MPGSMTGFGSGHAPVGSGHVSVEIRSVNSRFLDVRWHLPAELEVDRGPLEGLPRRRLERGRVDVRVTVELGPSGRSRWELDESRVDLIVSAGQRIAELHGVAPLASASEVLRVPGAFIERPVQPPPELQSAAKVAIEGALDALVAMRHLEGRKTCADLVVRLERMMELRGSVGSRVEGSVLERVARTRERLRQLLDAGEVDEGRLAQEVVLLADRADVSEELERLASHESQLRQLLNDERPGGRRMEFLLQEMNREVNTIGAKSNDVQIAHDVIEMKAELEKMREQVQNLE